MIDCIIAAEAIRAGLPILHAGVDFPSTTRHIAQVTVDP